MVPSYCFILFIYLDFSLDIQIILDINSIFLGNVTGPCPYTASE